MKIFHCDHCGQALFFENSECLSCGHVLAYLPDLDVLASLEAVDNGHWRSPLARAHGHCYRLCLNYAQENVCNWAVPAHDPEPLCISCRLTLVLPDLTVPGNKEAWYRLEVAKRRLVYTLRNLGLPLANKTEDPRHGLAFVFLAEQGASGAPVLTGHCDGVVTINVAEADDVERERRRLQMHEPYRTLLGHFRHEVGHYYWDRLILHSDRQYAFRQLFGDERADYSQALERHYQQGAPADWAQHFISAYASSHPWEDWAETWAHYIHISDTLEMATVCGMALLPSRADEPAMLPTTLPMADEGDGTQAFEHMISHWFAVSYVLNNLNRGLGLADAYPFVLSKAVIAKLKFVHETVSSWRSY